MNSLGSLSPTARGAHDAHGSLESMVDQMFVTVAVSYLLRAMFFVVSPSQGLESFTSPFTPISARS